MSRQDRSIEIMMEKLDEDLMKLFFQATYADVATAKAAIAAADPALLVRRRGGSELVMPHVDAGRYPDGIGRSLSGEHLAKIASKFDLVVVGAGTAPAAVVVDGDQSNDDVVAAAAAAAAAVVVEDEWRDGVPADVADAIERGDSVAAARAAIRRLLPLHELFPGLVCDDHVFAPCGYSVNGLAGPTHVTMHVTPEPTHSFISFDTNCAFGDAPAFMAFVTRRLRPGRASLSVVSDVCAPQALEQQRARPLALPFYRQKSRTTYEIFNADGFMVRCCVLRCEFTL
jgi:hypothetical protein